MKKTVLLFLLAAVALTAPAQRTRSSKSTRAKAKTTHTTTAGKSVKATPSTVDAITAPKGQNVLDLKHSISDQAIVFPETFEADTHKLLESWFIKNYTATDKRYETESDVQVSDTEMLKRLNSLPTVIEMTYNPIVRSYIDRYTSRSRAQIAALLGLSLYYMPVFEQALEQEGLPIELKYLPVIESGLDPNAVSKHGAAGLWQFLVGTAKGLGLEVNSLVDERRDPYMSSEKAAKYLKDLYSTYGDWSLAIAAYNCGPSTVNKAIRRAGGNPKDHDFWSIYTYLPEETRGYVPMFIAANYVMNYYPQHNISPVLPVKPLVTDTLQIAERIHFNQISKVLDIPVEELRILNPQFRADIIPGSPESTFTLILPSQQVHAYLMSENDIRNFDAAKYAQRGVVQPGDLPADTRAAVDESTDLNSDEGNYEVALAASQGKPSVIVHKVKAGETLSSIAKKYGITTAEVKEYNNLSRNSVRVGQQLRIASSSDGASHAETTIGQQEPAKTSRTETAQAAAPKATTTTHKVKSGESLYLIAKKYGTTIDAIKKGNNLKSDNLHPGQTLTIPAGKTSTAKSTSTARSSSKSKSTSKKSTRKRKR